MKALKIAGIVIGAIVLLAMLAVVVVVALFDPNDYKKVVTDAFQARTGRTLAIDQDLKLSFFPWLAVETGGITIGNAAGFGEGANGAAPLPFATIERAAARVKLMPLLDRHVEIGTVELDGLTLNLARDAALHGNWQDLADAASRRGAEPDPSARQGQPTPPGAAAATPQSFALEGVRVRRGTLYWRENTTQLRYTASNLDLSTGAIGGGGPVPVDLSLDLHDEASGRALAAKASARTELDAPAGAVTLHGLDATLELAAQNGVPARTLIAKAESVAFDATRGTLAVDGLETETAGVRATGRLTASKLADSPEIEGSVQVADAPVAGAFAALGLSAPPGVTPEQLGRTTLAAQFTFATAPRAIAVRGVDAQLLGMHVTGEGTLKGENELAGRIAIPPFAPSPTLTALLRSAVPPTVDVAALGKLGLTARFDANLETGRSALHDFKADALGTTVTGELEAVPGTRGNVFRGSIATTRFAPDAFTKAFAKLLPKSIDAHKLGMVQLKTKFSFDSAIDGVDVGPFEAELFGLRASGDLAGRNVSKTASWTGHATIAQFSPQDLLQRFGVPPLKTADPRAFTRAAIDTRFTVDAKHATFDDVALALDDSKITGHFAVEGFDDPRYAFMLAIDRVDADRYMPPKADRAQQGQKTAGDIELPAQNTLKLDGNVQVADLKLAGLQFAGVGTRIVLAEGNAKLENARARLYGGEFNGSFNARAAGDKPGLALEGHASGLALSPVIQALTGEPANFSGTGTFDLDLAGSGRTIMDNVKTAAGKVGFAMRDGAIKGFNVASTLCTAYNATQGLPGPRGDQPKQTSYQVIQGSATVTNGVAQSNDLLARTSFMDVTGKGSLRLGEQRLDYDLVAKLTGKVAIQNCETMTPLIGDSIPFNLKGTVADPSITPDFSKILRDRVREQAKKRLTDKLLEGIFH